MWKPATILLTVMMLCVAETLLLFSIAVPGRYAFEGRQLVAMVTGYLLMAVIAAFFSRWNYGNRKWYRRTAAIITVPVMGFFVFIAISWGGSKLVEAAGYGHRVNIDLMIFTLDAFLFICAVFGMWKRSRRRSVELDTENWLSQRHSGLNRTELIRRRRTIAIALWMPTASVLLAFLFLPQVWGLASHVVHFNEKRIAGHRLVLPTSWVVLGVEDRFVYGVTVSGIAQEPRKWISADIPISGWSFSDQSGFASQSMPNDEILETRSFLSGNDSIRCTRYSQKRLGKPDSRYVFIKCSGVRGFTADLIGEARDIPKFYDVLNRIRSNEGLDR